MRVAREVVAHLGESSISSTVLMAVRLAPKGGKSMALERCDQTVIMGTQGPALIVRVQEQAKVNW